MKKIVYEMGPERIDVGGIGIMQVNVPVEVSDEKAADLLNNPMFKDVSKKDKGKGE